MIAIIYLIVIIIGMVVSYPFINPTLQPVFLSMVSVYAVFIVSTQVILYKKIMSSEFLYIRTVMTILEASIYLLLVIQTHWIWATILGLAGLATAGHLKVVLSNDQVEKNTYEKLVNDKSDEIHNMWNQLGRQFKHKILRMKAPESEKKPNIMKERMDRLKKHSPDAATAINMCKLVMKSGQGLLYKETDSKDPLTNAKYWYIERTKTLFDMSVTVTSGTRGYSVGTERRTRRFDTLEEMENWIELQIIIQLKDGYKPEVETEV